MNSKSKYAVGRQTARRTHSIQERAKKRQGETRSHVVNWTPKESPISKQRRHTCSTTHHKTASVILPWCNLRAHHVFHILDGSVTTNQLLAGFHLPQIFFLVSKNYLYLRTCSKIPKKKLQTTHKQQQKLQTFWTQISGTYWHINFFPILGKTTRAVAHDVLLHPGRHGQGRTEAQRQQQPGHIGGSKDHAEDLGAFRAVGFRF